MERKGIGDDGFAGSGTSPKVGEKDPVREISSRPEFLKIPRRSLADPAIDLPVGHARGKSHYARYPMIRLPFQKIWEISSGKDSTSLKNRLYWGDNLHVMRMLPSESIDLIYMDPPFFSGKYYNGSFGEEETVRSFSDIWGGGISAYIGWLSARLLEMKRLLKSTGTIFVHLDWHASHYVKTEMDRIFGYSNFINEIVWCYSTSGRSRKGFSRKHDNILFYSRSPDYQWNEEGSRIPYSESYIESHFRDLDDGGKRCRKRYDAGKWRTYYPDEGMIPNDWWEIPYENSMSKGRNGYPTQKPEALLERIIKSTTREGDIVADFFAGSGTTVSVAQRLGRSWIGSDISRKAIEITRDRVMELMKNDYRIWERTPHVPDMEILSWGCYDISPTSGLSDEDFRHFILEAFGARKVRDRFITGMKQGIPVLVGPRERHLSIDDSLIREFAGCLDRHHGNRKRGMVIGWQFSDKVRLARDLALEAGSTVDLVSMEMAETSAGYPDYIRFVLPPAIRLKTSRTGSFTYRFDFTESVSLNGGEIVGVQADLDFNGNFSPTEGCTAADPRGTKGMLSLECRFNGPGTRRIAFNIRDDRGGEAMLAKDLIVA